MLQEAGLGHLLEPQPYRKRGAGRAAPVAAEPPATWLAGKPVCRHCLQPGDILTHRQLQDIFHCSPQGGMRRSLKTNSLVLISNHTQGNYLDRWQDGCFHYTGMGLEGDQSLDFAQNRTLAESRQNGVEVFLFEVCHKGHFTFTGRMELAGEPYQEIQPGAQGLDVPLKGPGLILIAGGASLVSLSAPGRHFRKDELADPAEGASIRLTPWKWGGT